MSGIENLFAQETDAADTPLDRLREREDVLQICFWYQGEGFGDCFAPGLVMPFLNSGQREVLHAFEALVASGELARQADGYILTDAGRRKAGRMFSETFVEFQQPGHGECQDGCCDGDQPCAHNGPVVQAASVPDADCTIAHRPGEPCTHIYSRMRYVRN